MKIATSWSTNPDPIQAAEQAYTSLIGKMAEMPQIMLVHASCLYDGNVLLGRLSELAPGVPMQGGTSCLGVMTEDGFHTENGFGIGLLGIWDPEGAYGVGIADLGDHPHAAVQTALKMAFAQAGRPGEVPSAVLVGNVPGHEELVIRTIEEFVGSGVPIIGATSADNDMSGQWRQFANNRVSKAGVSVAVLFPSGEVGFSFHSGYEPAGPRGMATKASGRILYEIDERPAARVYNEWTNGLISGILPAGGGMVPTATFSPLGNPVGQVRGVSYYRLSYPVEALPGEALLLFTEVEQDSEIALMRGTPDNLLHRTGKAATAALDAAPFSAKDVRGALVLFCTGSMLAVQERMEEARKNFSAALQGAPFLCTFGLGEQGCFIGGENRHGNLMVVVMVFGPSGSDK